MTKPNDSFLNTSAADLKSTLECAITNGHGPDCIKIWEATRDAALQAGKKTHANYLQTAINKIKRGPAKPQSGRRAPPAPVLIALESIIEDHTVQIRVENDADQIDNIIEAMESGAEIPPIDLFLDDSGSVAGYYIGDGWHRFLGAKTRRAKEIRAIVHPGGRPAALKHALGANAAHGLRRTSKDKRNAVTLALTEFPKVSDRAISDLCKVDHKTVAAVRKQLGNFPSSRLGADGKERQLPTGKPVQMTLFDRLNEQFKPIADRIDIVCKAPWWIDKEIPHAEKMEAATSLENRLKGDLQRVQDLKKNLLKSEQPS